jgi:hypothetical protein
VPKYFYDQEMEIDPSIVISEDFNLLVYHFLPFRWNEDSIDLIQLHLVENVAIVIGNQISLKTTYQHSSSTNWLRIDGKMVKALKCRGFDVTKVLLFTCSQDPIPRISVDSEHFKELKDT